MISKSLTGRVWNEPVEPTAPALSASLVEKYQYTSFSSFVWLPVSLELLRSETYAVSPA